MTRRDWLIGIGCAALLGATEQFFGMLGVYVFVGAFMVFCAGLLIGVDIGERNISRKRPGNLAARPERCAGILAADAQHPAP